MKLSSVQSAKHWKNHSVSLPELPTRHSWRPSGRSTDWKLMYNMNVNTRLFPDTLSTLKELKKRGARVGIISTKYRFRILSYLEEFLPKDFLDIVVGGEDVKAPKPSPEGVKFALEHLGSSPEETLYIGDSTVDAETAQNAGVDFAGVLNGMTTGEELRVYPHKIIMQNLGELVQ